MTQLMTKLARATRAGAYMAILAIVGVTMMASAQPVRAWDSQTSEATDDDVTNRQAAGLGDAVVSQPGPYASARHARRSETPAARKDFQDIK